MTRKRRKYTQEFKESAVKLVTEQGYRITEAARNLGVNENLLGKWKRDIEGGKDGSPSLQSESSIQSELNQLKKENKRLKMEREILKKAAAFFANEMS